MPKEVNDMKVKVNPYKMAASSVLAGAVTLGSMMGTGSAAPQTPPPVLEGYNDSGVQLNRTREYLERQRVAQQIAEDRAKQQEKVQGSRQEQEKEQGALKFMLKEVTTDESAVLTKEEIAEAVKPYEGREVQLQDLYAITGRLNELYAEKGYLTCRAYLAPQTIKGGVVHISLIEGRTGTVTVQGNKDTKEQYIKSRLSLDKGEISNINELNDDLLRFNGTNDVQLRISMQAGTEPGTTDYVISAYEPKRTSFSVYSDNAGSESSGLYRGGFFYTDRSLNGWRDTLTLSTIFSKGTKSFSAGYVMPAGRSGTKLSLAYSTNSVEIIDGDMEPLDVKGHSNAFSLSVIQPLRVTETLRTEASLGFDYQNSQTDFLGLHWVDDTTNAYTAGYSITNYGDSSVVYQKHSYRRGNTQNIDGDDTRFGTYRFSGLYQKAYAHGQILSGRLDAQRSSNVYLPSAEQFYIGGMYSVRGYKESLLGGDHGYAASIEYSVPLDEARTTSLFTFFDYGAVYGESAFDDHVLAGTGLGIKSNIGDHVYTSVTLGVPLRRELNGTEVSKARVHFMFNSQF